MSSSKLISLPKTQPTLSSSSRTRIKTHKKLEFSYINPYPEVSPFSTDDKEEIYTHNMKIDYGKLSKPFAEEIKKSINKEV
jgi:hypothetical protein